MVLAPAAPAIPNSAPAILVKSYPGQIKAASEGKATIVFATLNVIDKDGDYTPSGEIGEQIAMLLPAHKWDHPAIGSAKIYEDGNDAVAELTFYLNMASGREWWESLKGNFEQGVNQEFSYGFNAKSEPGNIEGRHCKILRSIKVHEVSPVVVGAGVDTRTLALKASAQIAGSWEQTQSKIRVAAQSYFGSSEDRHAYLEATTDASAIVCVYDYTTGTEKFYSFGWSQLPDGNIALSAPTEVVIEASVRAKAAPLDQAKRLRHDVAMAVARSKQILSEATEEQKAAALQSVQDIELIAVELKQSEELIASLRAPRVEEVTVDAGSLLAQFEFAKAKHRTSLRRAHA